MFCFVFFVSVIGGVLSISLIVLSSPDTSVIFVNPLISSHVMGVQLKKDINIILKNSNNHLCSMK